MSKRSSSYKRTYPKQKWSVNMTRIDWDASPSLSSLYAVEIGKTIVENPKRLQSNGSIATTATNAAILKVGRLKFKGVVWDVQTIGLSVMYYIAYKPENYTLMAATGIGNTGNAIPFSHPEWVMAWTQRDYSNAAQSNEISISTNLKRNLNPGDSIIMGALIINQTGATLNNFKVEGTVQFVCRNN